MVTSVAPIPTASMMNREWGQMGQNIAITDDVSTAVWTCIGYTVLLCFTLFKTSSLAKSVFNAH